MPIFSSSLVNDFWIDLHDVRLLWQIGAILVCIVLAWSMARALRKTVNRHEVQMRAMRLGMESFGKVLAPLLALIFILIAKLIMEKWYPAQLLRLAIPLIGSFALIRLGFYVVRRVFVRDGRAGSFLLLFEKIFATLVWFGVALYITGLWHELVQSLDDIRIPLGLHKVTLLTISQAVVSVIVTLIVALWAGAVLEERLMQIDGVHLSLRAVIARMGRACLILIAILVSLSLVGIDLTVLSVFGGALGVGLGLGLQKIASNYVSGFVILLERGMTIGDMVTVDKYYGRVTQINTRYTVLQGLDGIETVVPNEMFVSSPVQNASLTNRTLRLGTQVTVDYQTDVEFVLQLLEQAAVSVERVLKTPVPQAVLLKFGADGLELELGFWIDDPENGRGRVTSDVNRAIWRSLQAHQIAVPYPQREVRLIDERCKGQATNK